MKKFAQAIRAEGVPRTIGKLAIFTFVIGVLMSVFAIVSALNVRKELADAFSIVARLRDEQTGERELLSRIVDAETGLRGYALTGEESYLEPFVIARDTISNTKARYLASRTGVPSIYEKFDSALESSWTQIARAVEDERKAWPDTTELRQRIGAIKQSVDVVRDEQAILDRTLSEKLEERRARANATVSTLLTALSVLSLGLILLSFAQLREMTLQAANFLRSERKSADEISGLEKEVALSRAELEWVNRQLSITLRSAGVQVFTLNARGEIDWVADAQSRLSALNTTPCSLTALIPDEERVALLEALAKASEQGVESDLELRIAPPESAGQWIKLHLAPQQQGKASIVLGCAFDITDLKQREENNFWLMRELSHRSKNLLAIVQSMARQTARSALDKEAFLSRISQRLQALAASHDLLVKTDYAGVSLEELVRSQMIGAGHWIGTRVFLSGPEVIIRAEAAQNLGMALHELSANALAHGALGHDGGRVDITWGLEAGAREPMLVLDWLESGGAQNLAPEVAGFGDTLIRMNLPRSLEGEVTLDHAPEGTRCHMRLPLRRLKPELITTL